MVEPQHFTNKLANEKSPYLLQHADNPVNWYPWSEEAFNLARRENKPVFLSIGYSTCHWCHVMEHESFEDKDMAELINTYFVAVKVDREERPDIDNVYMSAVMAMTGSGGWPLTVFLTPDKKPFFGGTYFPPSAKWGSPGLGDVLIRIHQMWEKDRDGIINSSHALTEQIFTKPPAEKNFHDLTPTVFFQAFNEFASSFDKTFAGFGHSPKFPTSHNLSFLLRYWKRSQSKEALMMAEETLKKMAYGGVYDHLGGGFHRYSTDREWQVPHFEKMLYDQAILAVTYLEAYQITKNDFYAETARDIFDYVLRDMQDSTGGFYSAEDADSYDPAETKAGKEGLHKKEGAFYLWDDDEIISIIGQVNGEIFNYCFGVEKGGNAKYDPHGEFTGKNIIYVAKDISSAAVRFNKSEKEIKEIIRSAKGKLLQERNKRPRPHLDDKILVDWNGLMIAALSFGARVLNEPKYEQASKKSADFIISRLIDGNGRLLHRYRDNEANILGTLEDYAFFTHGLLMLYESNFDVKYLSTAHKLVQEMARLFEDKKEGGFYFTAHDAEKLISRQKEVYDGAIPSGNSIASLVLLKFYRITFDRDFEDKARAIFKFFSPDVFRHPSAYSQLLMAFDFALGPSQEIVFVGRRDSLLQSMVEEVYNVFLPNKVLLFKDDNNSQMVHEISSFTSNQKIMNGLTTVYVCENQNCLYPTNDLFKLKEMLR